MIAYIYKINILHSFNYTFLKLKIWNKYTYALLIHIHSSNRHLNHMGFGTVNNFINTLVQFIGILDA